MINVSKLSEILITFWGETKIKFKFSIKNICKTSMFFYLCFCTKLVLLEVPHKNVQCNVLYIRRTPLSLQIAQNTNSLKKILSLSLKFLFNQAFVPLGMRMVVQSLSTWRLPVYCCSQTNKQTKNLNKMNIWTKNSEYHSSV